MFRKFFGRDYRYYRERGEKFLADGRYADARNEFSEALQRLEPGSADFASAEVYLRERVREAGNRLGRLNLTEAEHALDTGEFDKARDHLDLACDLAEDVTIREKAEKLKQAIPSSPPVVTPSNNNNSCAGCSGAGHKTSGNSHVEEGELSAADRFEILIQTLPGDLPQRYADLGEKFACGYMLAHDGEDDAAYEIFSELLAHEENDILLYEAALICHRKGVVAECERLLRRAHGLNGTNPLVCLGLVQLFSETGRANDAIAVLYQMIAGDILSGQARVLLGDVLLILAREHEAMERYGEALTFPEVASSAAERLIPLLEGQGRSEEASYLFKRYLKGCC